MLAGVFLRFACRAFALLVGWVLVRRELAGPSARSLTCVLLGLDRGALVGLMGRVLVGLERSRTGLRSRRGDGPMGDRSRSCRGVGQGTEEERAGHPAGGTEEHENAHGHDAV